MKYKNDDMIVADRLLEAYLNELAHLNYIDPSGKNFFKELSRINNCPVHDFIVAALVDFIVGLENDKSDYEEDEEETIH